MNLCGVNVGPDQPCRFVAEISNNHNGDRDRCGRLIDAAQAAGADVVKAQCYTPDELVALRGDGPAPEPWGAQGWTMRTLYAKAATPLEWFPKIAAHCARVGMPWFSSVFGPDSLALLQSLDCPAYKLASLDYGKAELYQAVKATGKPLVRSLYADGGRILGVPNESSLMCSPGYPQERAHLKNLWTGYDGFSYHGTNPGVPVLAAAMGAQLVECHLQLLDEPSELEANVSLDERQFQAMVEAVRANEALAR